jgi:hypothetical protein
VVLLAKALCHKAEFWYHVVFVSSELTPTQVFAFPVELAQAFIPRYKSSTSSDFQSVKLLIDHPPEFASTYAFVARWLAAVGVAAVTVPLNCAFHVCHSNHTVGVSHFTHHVNHLHAVLLVVAFIP